MTIPSIVRIALVSHFSEVGDWALQAALRVARSRPAALNIYYFLESAYEVPLNKAPIEVRPPKADPATLVRKEREVREYFEERLDDFEEVRFRVCETGRHNQELRRCLLHREYQLLIIPCPRHGVSFGNMPIEEFAYRFGAPVLLVGPERQDQYRLNPFAGVLQGARDLVHGPWAVIREPQSLQALPVI
jgi:hypothetical protein